MALAQSKEVEAFQFGDHLHYFGMPACQNCEEANAAWDNLYTTRGPNYIAMRLRRSPNYRAYVQARPFDDTEAILSLDMLTEVNGYEAGNGDEAHENVFHSQVVVDQFLQTLTQKQQDILRLLIMGWKPKEIYSRFGYRNTGGIRYHKYIIRQKWQRFER